MSKLHGNPVPKFHYEMKSFPIVKYVPYEIAIGQGFTIHWVLLSTGFYYPLGYPVTGFYYPLGFTIHWVLLSTGFYYPLGYPATGFYYLLGYPATGFYYLLGYPATGFYYPLGLLSKKLFIKVSVDICRKLMH